MSFVGFLKVINAQNSMRLWRLPIAELEAICLN